MATKKSAGKAVAATKKTVKKKAGSKAAVAGARKATSTADALASPEKERSQDWVGASMVGAPARDDAVSPAWSQEGDTLTTATGTPVDNTDNSVRVGPRGPALLLDHHLRDKIMHFDHERIPERVVHARGTGAHGRFELTDSLADVTCARVLSDTAGRRRCSCGSRPSSDPAGRLTPPATFEVSPSSSTLTRGSGTS